MCVHLCNYYPDPDREPYQPPRGSTKKHCLKLTLIGDNIIVSDSSSQTPQLSMWSLLKLGGKNDTPDIHIYTVRVFTVYTMARGSGNL